MARTLYGLAVALAVLAAGPAGAVKPNPHAALDCSFCHFDTPRFGVDTRETVNFWVAEGDEPQLCERCHGPESNFHPLGVVPGPERMGTRAPGDLPLGTSEAVRGQVVCISCHFIHAPDASWALLRGFPGDASVFFSSWQDLCRQCHASGLELRSPHAGDDRSCAFCHSSKPQPGQAVTVTPVGRQLCEFCHGKVGPAHYAGVNPYNEPRDCTGCHDPHLGKDSPARLKAGYLDPIRDEVTLNPHRKRTLCFACHQGGSTGGTLRGGDAVALCQRCHGSGKIAGMSHPMTKVPAGYTIPPEWPLVDGKMTCLTCHWPGHPAGTVAGRAAETGGTPHLLRGGIFRERTAVCFRCHPREQWAGRNPHREVAEGKTGCAQCHAGKPQWGVDTRETVAFVADVNILCLACHERAEHPSGVTHTVTLTPAMLSVPELLPLGPGKRITCATCHNPHIDPPVGHRLRGAKDASAFCVRCHKF